MGQDPKNKAHFLEAFQIMDLILSNGWDSKTGYFKGQPAAASIQFGLYSASLQLDIRFKTKNCFRCFPKSSSWKI